jgi:hypothetical protein
VEERLNSCKKKITLNSAQQLSTRIEHYQRWQTFGRNVAGFFWGILPPVAFIINNL